MTLKLTDPRVITGFDEANLVKLRDILLEHKEKLKEGNAFEHWERVTITTPSVVDTEFLVETINLDRIPSYYLILKKDKAVDVYTGVTDWSKDKMYLKANVSSATITLLVVV